MSNPLANLSEADIVIGAQAATMAPSTIEVYGQAGLDFVWIDLEHKGESSANSHSLANLLRAAENSGTTLMVRPNSTDSSMIRKMLDSGLRNIVIPRVRTAEEVRKAVAATRFTYDGEPGDRGSSLSRASRWGFAPKNYAAQEDAAVVVGILVENVTAVENIDEILSVPELGFVRIGEGDLSVSAGHPGNKAHPDVQELISRIETACLEHRIPLSGQAHGTDAYAQKVERGYQILTLGNDLSILGETIRERLSTINHQD